MRSFNKLRSCRFVLVVLVLLHAAPVRPDDRFGQADPAGQAGSDANLLLEVRLDQHLMADAVNAYQYGDDVFLPLGELARLLTIAIRTDPGQARASGYILDEQRGFSLDVLERVLVRSDKREVLDRSRIKLQADDIYVASRTLAAWLPLDLVVDLPSLTLRVHARETLPVQARLERQNNTLRAGARAPYADPGYPRQATPYRLLDMPFIDQTLGFDLVHGGDRTGTSADYTAYLTSDLAGLEAALYLNNSRLDRGPAARLTLGRNDPDAGLLGPLRARTVQIGSVAVQGVTNVSFGSATGNGVKVSNRPLGQPTRFDRHSLQGDLPPGWDVELYFNEALIAFQQSRPDGKYSFEDQPLVYGANEFRLVFHGPLGQLRVERQSFLMEQSLLAPGELVYTLTGHRTDDGRERTLAQFDVGIGEQLTATAGMTRVPIPFGEGEQHYSNIGLHGYWQSFIVSADLARSGDGGSLAQLALKTRVGGLAVSASRARLKEFSSEVFRQNGAPIRVRDEVRVDGVLPLTLLQRFPFSFSIKRDQLVTDASNLELSARVSAYQHGNAVSNALRWQSWDGRKFADGVLQASRRTGSIGISGQLQYAMEPDLSLSAVALSGDKNFGNGYLLNVGIARTFPDPQYRFNAALNKSVGSFGFGVNAHYTSRGEYGAGLRLFMAMGQEPRSGRWLTDANSMATSGSASARVFLDKNLNGVMDAGDEPLKGAGFTVNGGGSLARTGDDGVAYLKRLPANQHVDIGFDSSTLEDPQWLVQQKGVRLVPRPGKVSQLEFPVVMSGEIDGTTFLLVGEVKRAVGDLELELVDDNRKVIATTKSASDGYFVLDGVIPGNYLLRISPAQLKRLGMNDFGMHLFTVAPDGSFVNAREFYVAADTP